MIIVIPAYCPDSKLILLLQEIKARTDSDIIVIDDGSGENYKEVFREVRDYATVLGYEKNQGKGHALKMGFEFLRKIGNVEHDIVITADSDGQHTVSDMIHTAKALEESHADLMLGSREFTRNVPIKSKFGNTITRMVFHLATGVKIRDTQTGLRAFWGRDLMEMEQIKGERYEYEMNVLLEFSRRKKRIEETKIATIYLDDNKSTHFHPVRDSFYIYKEIFKFMISSFTGFVLDFFLYWIFVTLLAFLGGTGVLISNVAARVISATINFEINRRWVFEKTSGYRSQLISYFLLAAGILSANTILLLCFVQVFGWNKMLAKILVEIILFCVSFFVQHRVIFRRTGNIR